MNDTSAATANNTDSINRVHYVGALSLPSHTLSLQTLFNVSSINSNLRTKRSSSGGGGDQQSSFLEGRYGVYVYQMRGTNTTKSKLDRKKTLIQIKD